MDRTLLEKETRKPTGDEPAVLEHGSTTNNEEQHAEVTQLVEESQFEELAVDPPQKPVRLALDPPVVYDGKTYKELVCDFDKMVGMDYIRAEREFRHMFRPATKGEIPFAQMNPEFHTIVIAHAADVPTGVIKKLQIRQFTALQSKALKIFGSSSEEEKA
jgi:hypothetical protein